VENSTVAFFQALSAFDFKAGVVIVTTRNDYISKPTRYLSLARRYGVECGAPRTCPAERRSAIGKRELLRDARVRLLAYLGVRPFGADAPVAAIGEIAEAAAWL